METHEHRNIIEEAYAEWFTPIFRFLSMRLGDRERSLELTQEVFMKTWLYLKDGNEITHMRAFLYKSAYNLFVNEIRRKKDAVSLDTLMDESFFEPESKETSAEDRFETALLLEKLGDLGETYSEILRLRYSEGLEVKEIAKILSISPITASVRIHRGLQKLRTLYEQEPDHRETEEPREAFGTS